MRPRDDETTRLLKQQIHGGDSAMSASETGTVLSIQGGIARIDGLASAMAGERLVLAGQGASAVAGLVLELRRHHVTAAVLGEASALQPGDGVRRTGQLLDVPVGEGLLGRVVDALGVPIDGKGPIITELRGRAFAKGHGIVRRRPPLDPLHTGIKIIDALVPIAAGSQVLLLGDPASGKTTMAVDTILAQASKVCHCIYVAIGQRLGDVRRVVELLSARGAMEHTTVVVAAAHEPAPLRYLAPFTGMAIGEHYRDTGRHALCILDDLSSHASAYSEMSLLLDRPPGREGYPADTVSLHARLLERAALPAGAEEARSGGSLTAISLVETRAGDCSAYIPRNLLAMSDGWIVLDPELIRAGVRPAVNVRASRACGRPSRLMRPAIHWKNIGYAVQEHRAMAELARLTPDLDDRARAQLDRGARIIEVLQQAPHEPLPVEEQVLILRAVTRGLLGEIPLSELRRFERELYAYVASEHPRLLTDMLAVSRIDERLEQRMDGAIKAFTRAWLASHVAVGPG